MTEAVHIMGLAYSSRDLVLLIMERAWQEAGMVLRKCHTAS